MVGKASLGVHRLMSWICYLTWGLSLILGCQAIEPMLCVTQEGEVSAAGRCDSAQPWLLLLPPVRTQAFIERASDVQLNTCHPLASCFQSPPFSFLAGCLLIYSLISIWRKRWEWMQLASVQWNIPDNSSVCSAHENGSLSKSLVILNPLTRTYPSMQLFISLRSLSSF